MLIDNLTFKKDSALLDHEDVLRFRHTLYAWYKVHGRHTLPWRLTRDPYHILISEVMLQQTQVSRVLVKYPEFLEIFPNIHSLAHASLREVLAAWSGLGYNRRGQMLHRAAQQIVHEHDGIVPSGVEALDALPGIGINTAGSIGAFAFNAPTVFIETNIRTVFLHTFFSEQEQVSDNLLFPLIAQTVDPVGPRKWYYALMDYGTMLKKNFPNPNKRSKHYTIQSKFEGSDRQIRGAVIRFLSTNTHVSVQELKSLCACEDIKFDRVIRQLIKDCLIHCEENIYRIAGDKN